MPNFCLLIPLVHCFRNTPTHPTSIHYSSWYTASEIHPHTQLLFTNPHSTLPQKYTHTSNFHSLFLLVPCLRNTPTFPTSVSNPPSTLPQKYIHTSNFHSLFLLVPCLRNTPTFPTSVSNPPSTLPQKYTHTPNFCLLILIVHCLRNIPTLPTSIHYSFWCLASTDLNRTYDE